MEVVVETFDCMHLRHGDSILAYPFGYLITIRWVHIHQYVR